MDMRKLVGRNFEKLRKAKGFTQERFAEASAAEVLAWAGEIFGPGLVVASSAYSFLDFGAELDESLRDPNLLSRRAAE